MDLGSSVNRSGFLTINNRRKEIMTTKKEEFAVSTDVKKIDLATNFLPSQDELNIMTAIVQAVTAGTRNPASAGQCLNIALSARELGLPIMGAVNGLLYMVGGQVGMSALTMRHLIKSQGHEFKIVEADDDHCKVIGKRKDTGEKGEYTYTMEMATKAGYVKPGGNYQTVPEDMMVARATAKLARRLFEDVIASCPYTTEELHDITPNDENVSDAEVVPGDVAGDEDLAKEIAKASGDSEEKSKVTVVKEKAVEKKVAKKPKLTEKQKKSKELADRRAEKLAEKEAKDKAAQEAKESKVDTREEDVPGNDESVEGEVVEVEFTVTDDVEAESTLREQLDVRVAINSETDERFDSLIKTEETDRALAYAAKQNEEEVDDMVARIMNDGVFDSFWTWLANFVIKERGVV